jgi:four helix bundle protein
MLLGLRFSVRVQVRVRGFGGRAPLATHFNKRRQLEKSVAGPPGHIAEGYRRFNPPDFANFCVFARSSLMESQNHLMDPRERRIASRQQRLSKRKRADRKPDAPDRERRTSNSEPRTEPRTEPEPEHEQRTENREE